MQDGSDKALSTDIIDRYNDAHRKLANRPDLKPISGQLDKAMDAFRKAAQAAEDALTQAERALT